MIFVQEIEEECSPVLCYLHGTLLHEQDVNVACAYPGMFIKNFELSFLNRSFPHQGEMDCTQSVTLQHTTT